MPVLSECMCALFCAVLEPVLQNFMLLVVDIVHLQVRRYRSREASASCKIRTELVNVFALRLPKQLLRKVHKSFIENHEKFVVVISLMVSVESKNVCFVQKSGSSRTPSS